MKSLFKVAGIILAALFAVSMFASATASAAAPVWEHCASGSGTKYTTNQCTTASSSGTFAWQEITGTEAVKGVGTLRLADTKASILGETSVQCAGTTEGLIGPGKLDKTTKATALKCEIVRAGGCEKLEGVAEARNLPWQTELFETEKKVFDKLTQDGAGQPGWAVTCKTALGTKTDVCTTESGSEETTETVNEATAGSLLVRSAFTGKKKASCTEGGAKSGEVVGKIAILSASGVAIRVS